VVGIRNTTIYGANGGTLGFFVEAHTLRAFVGGDVIDLIADRFLYGIGVYLPTIGEYHPALKGSAVAVAPFIGTLVNRGIRAFGFAGPAIDTLVCYDDSHGF
jgi:hypothetical protein